MAEHITEQGNTYDGRGNLVKARPLDKLKEALDKRFQEGYDAGYVRGLTDGSGYGCDR